MSTMGPAPLLLVGAGGFARETLELIRAINRVAPTWSVLGLLDDNPSMQGRVVGGAPVIGGSAAVHEHPDAMVVACVASPDEPGRRLALVDRLRLPAERYARLVHPTAVLPESASAGPGSVVHATSVLTADVAIGAHVAVMPAVVLTHDVVVEDGVTFGTRVSVAGGATIGRGAYIGAGALVRERLTVGAGALVGMGAVVTKPVPDGEVWVGVPARPAGVVEEVGS
jgi:sugar O-acyltransferase (sialic acid O-acetyltransferase NeuD family)